jgi:hypothetical protein
LLALRARAPGKGSKVAEDESVTSVIDVVLAAGVIVLSIGLAGTTWLSLHRTGNRRLIWVTAAFAAFALKGLLTALSIFAAVAIVPVDTVLLLVDLVILLLLYLSLIMK